MVDTSKELAGGGDEVTRILCMGPELSLAGLRV